MGRAASDDAGGASAAVAAHSAAARADREACAEVAEAHNNGKRSRPNGADGTASRLTANAADEMPQIAAGENPLPEDGISFVEAVHERIDLVAIAEKLLRSADEKIIQRAFERLLEMKYGKGPAPADDPPISLAGMPEPIPGYRCEE